MPNGISIVQVIFARLLNIATVYCFSGGMGNFFGLPLFWSNTLCYSYILDCSILKKEERKKKENHNLQFCHNGKSTKKKS